MSIGKRRSVVTFNLYQSVKNEVYGGVSAEATETFDLYANVKDRSQRWDSSLNAMIQVNNKVFEVRADSRVTDKHQIVFNNKTYKIVNIDIDEEGKEKLYFITAEAAQ